MRTVAGVTASRHGARARGHGRTGSDATLNSRRPVCDAPAPWAAHNSVELQKCSRRGALARGRSLLTLRLLVLRGIVSARSRVALATLLHALCIGSNFRKCARSGCCRILRQHP